MSDRAWSWVAEAVGAESW